MLRSQSIGSSADDTPADEGGRSRRLVRFWLTDVALPLLIGGLVYILWRPTTLRMFDWADGAGLAPVVTQLRVLAAPVRPAIPTWWVNCFPDGAWVYAYTAHFGLLWRGQRRWSLQAAAWISLGAVLGFGGEFGQAAGMVPGTFYWIDVWAMAVATLLATWRIRKLWSVNR